MAASIPRSCRALRKLLGRLSTLFLLCFRAAGQTEQGRLFPKSGSSADSRWVKQVPAHSGFGALGDYTEVNSAAAELGWVCLEFHGSERDACQKLRNSPWSH